MIEDHESIDNFFGSFGQTHQENNFIRQNHISTTREGIDHITNHNQSDTPHQELIRKRTEVTEALEHLGEIRNLNTIHNPRNICICVQQNHGAVEFLKNMSDDSMKKWFFHQRDSIDVQERIVQAVGAENVEFFIEGFPDQLPIDHIDPQSIERTEKLFNEASLDSQQAKSCIDRLYAMPKESHVNVLNMMMGMHRFVTRELVMKKIGLNQVHGLSFPNRDGLRSLIVQAQNPRDLHACQSTDFQLLHEQLVIQLRKNLGTGKTGIVLMGAAHFNTKQNVQNMAQFATKEEIERFKQISIEAYMNKLDSTSTLIMSPYSLRS